MITLAQTKTAVAVNITSSFAASGGTEPYTYSVLPNGAGGTIDPLTGKYTAPSTVPTDPKKLFDTIQVVDAVAEEATSQIMVGDPLLLLCEIIQKELGLANGRVFIWDQKIFQPHDHDLYIAVSEAMAKPFSNNVEKDATDGWSKPIQSANMMATIDLDILSRGPAARVRKEEVILALNSLYAQAQQETNSFYIGKLPAGSKFINLSMIDGAAIPYRYRISVNLQYAVVRQKDFDYYDEFEPVETDTDPEGD